MSHMFRNSTDRHQPIEGTDWIGRHPNGTLYGMAAQILNGEADLAISQASMVMLQMPDSWSNRSFRFTVLDFISYLHPTSATRLTAIFRQPDASSARDIITSTFSLQMWIGWIAVWILILLSVLVIKHALKMIPSMADDRVHVFNPFTNCNEKDADFLDMGEALTYRDSFLWCISQLSGQGNEVI
jgi:hypothetical protein